MNSPVEELKERREALIARFMKGRAPDFVDQHAESIDPACVRERRVPSLPRALRRAACIGAVAMRR